GALRELRDRGLELVAPALQALVGAIALLAQPGQARRALGAALARARRTAALRVERGERLRVLLLAAREQRPQLLELALHDGQRFVGRACLLAGLLERALGVAHAGRERCLALVQDGELLAAACAARLDRLDRLLQRGLALRHADHR